MTSELKRVEHFDLLSDAARERMRQRVIKAGGDIDSVAREVRARLEAHDHAGAEMAGDVQAERPFLLAQLSYLDALAAAQVDDQDAAQPGWFARLGNRLRGARAS